MPKESLDLVTILPVSPERVYQVWIDPDAHARFTGGAATGEPRVGGRFTAWDGYIEGTYLVLEPPSRIVMRWRTSEFPEGEGDSQLEIRFVERDGRTELRLLHTEIPEGQGARYESGWDEFYFEPLLKILSEERRSLRPPPMPTEPPPPRVPASAGSKQPAAKNPAAKKPTAKKPAAATKRPGVPRASASGDSKKPIAKKPGAKKPALPKKRPGVPRASASGDSKKPIAKKPTSNKRTAKKPAAKKPAAKKPVAKKPSAEKPAKRRAR
jgi:uncharacterized protein YndB with AHSA1/START domain